MTKVKICGLTSFKDVELVNKLKPDYIGYVFVKSSKRYLDESQARMLSHNLSSDIKAVGVFENENINLILILVYSGVIDIIQLHGDESEEYITALKEQTTAPIIKAVIVDNISEQNFTTAADFLLLDSGKGSGKVFDWSLIGKIDKPFFLAGGLNCDNVAEAIKTLSPYAVDVSSGVETGGRKVRKKVDAFLQAARENVSS